MIIVLVEALRIHRTLRWILQLVSHRVCIVSLGWNTDFSFSGLGWLSFLFIIMKIRSLHSINFKAITQISYWIKGNNSLFMRGYIKFLSWLKCFSLSLHWPIQSWIKKTDILGEKSGKGERKRWRKNIRLEK